MKGMKGDCGETGPVGLPYPGYRHVGFVIGYLVGLALKGLLFGFAFYGMLHWLGALK
jgi:hypothetical protein